MGEERYITVEGCEVAASEIERAKAELDKGDGLDLKGGMRLRSKSGQEHIVASADVTVAICAYYGFDRTNHYSLIGDRGGSTTLSADRIAKFHTLVDGSPIPVKSKKYINVRDRDGDNLIFCAENVRKAWDELQKPVPEPTVTVTFPQSLADRLARMMQMNVSVPAALSKGGSLTRAVALSADEMAFANDALQAGGAQPWAAIDNVAS